MKQIIATSILLFFIITSNAQPIVKMKSGNFSNTQAQLIPVNNEQVLTNSIYQNKYYVWLQVSQLLTVAQMQALKATGVELYNYLHDKTYYAAIPLGYNFSQLSSLGVHGIMPIPLLSKIDPSIHSYKLTHNWAIINDTTVKVVITYLPLVSSAQLMAVFLLQGVEVAQSVKGDIDGTVIISLSLNQIQKIIHHPLVQYVEVVDAPPVLEDRQATTNHRTNVLNTSENFPGGLKLTGKNVNVSIGDDGSIDTHIDFAGRIMRNLGSTSTTATHGDHCAGIMVGGGNFNPQVIGQAPESRLYAYGGYADFSAFPALYNIDSVRVTSHSLGQTCNEGYSSSARANDQQVRLYPSLMHVHSAGNSGNTTCGGLGGGWMTITGGYKAGKNVLAVANLTKADVISTTSSKGPARDGRIKPDIAAVGSSVNSTQPNNTFASNSGTSMACPAIAGSFALLNEAYKNVNAETEAKSGLLKAIMLNTADDLGNVGPDFTFGWGRVNNRRAVDAIINGRFITSSVAQSVTNSHTITIPANVAQVKVMTYWTDTESTAGSTRPLINDLDTRIIAPNSLSHLPWQLYAGEFPTSSSCAASAIKGTDTLNNVEQITIDAPNAGNYILRVTGTAVPSGTQEYFVVYDFIYSNQIVLTHPFGGEMFIPGTTQRLRWDANNDFGFFDVEYSTNGGASYQNIATGIWGETKHVDWLVPSNLITNNLTIRVSKNGNSDINNAPVTSIATPSGISFASVCEGVANISWNAVAGATGYDVMQLINTKMQVVGSTATTSFQLQNTGATENWYTVRAKINSSVGLRANAVSFANSSNISCALPVTLLSFNAVLKNSLVDIQWRTSTEINIEQYEVERSKDALFTNATVIGFKKALNSSLASYNVKDNLNNLRGIFYYRLKIIEKDGTVRYSNIEKVSLGKEQEIAVYPQPANNQLFIVNNEDMVNAKILLVSTLGSTILNTTTSLKANTPSSINISGVAPGTYILRIISADDKLITNKKIITQ